MSKYCLLRLYIEVVANRFSRCEAACYIPIKLNNIGELACRAKNTHSFGLIIIFVSKISAAMQEPHCQVTTARKQPSNIVKVCPTTNFKQIGKFQLGNIRESAYKIFRSSSKRSEHSLSAKKPIRVQQKFKEMQQSSNNVHKGYNKKEPKKKKMDLKEKSVILIRHEQNAPLNDSDFSKYNISDQSSLNQVSNRESCSLKQISREQQEIVLLRNIWQNLKELKEKTKFIVDIIEMELILHRILAKIANSSYDSERINQTDQKMQQFLTATCQTQIQTLKLNDTLDAQDSEQKFYNEQQSKRLMYIVDQEKKQQYSSMSLKIENEQLHSREFLHSYHEDICQNRLKDITYFDPKRNSLDNSENNKWSSYNDYSSENPAQSERVVLKTIVKKNKNTPRNQQCIVSTCDQIGTICKKGKFEQKTEPYCQLFDCERARGSKQNILSSEGSQSKRSALNKIILMLNQKYHKNLKQVSPKIHF